MSPGCNVFACSTTASSSLDDGSNDVSMNSAMVGSLLGLMILVSLNSLMKSCIGVGGRNNSTTSSEFISRNKAPLGSSFTPTTSGEGGRWESRDSFSIALFALVRMSASEDFATL